MLVQSQHDPHPLLKLLIKDVDFFRLTVVLEYKGLNQLIVMVLMAYLQQHIFVKKKKKLLSLKPGRVSKLYHFPLMFHIFLLTLP